MGEETEFIKKKSLADAASEAAQATFKHILYWKLVIARTGNKCVIALVTSLTASLNGNDWSSFSDTQKFVAVGCAIVAVSQIIDAVLSSAISEVAPEKADKPSDKPTDLQV